MERLEVAVGVVVVRSSLSEVRGRRSLMPSYACPYWGGGVLWQLRSQKGEAGTNVAKMIRDK